MIPKILVVSGAPFDEKCGDSSTLNSIFRGYDSNKLAQIYFETKTPKTPICNSFFQISEFSMLKKLFLWNTKVGTSYSSVDSVKITSNSDELKSSKIYETARAKHCVLFYYLRELLWSLGFWKNKRLKNFVEEFNPDIVWCESYPLPFMHKLNLYISKITCAKSVIFLQDDVYTYKPAQTINEYINRFFLRKVVKKDIEACSAHFVISSMMKKEYDRLFNIDSKILTKSIDASNLAPVIKSIHSPIKIIYLGNVVYGRIATLLTLAKVIDKINELEIKYELDIYTTQYISDVNKKEFDQSKGVQLCAPIEYKEVQNIMQAYDIVLIVESLEHEYKDKAWLSFSTKITDSLASGRGILAIGPKEIAPIDYLISNEAAIVITAEDEIYETMMTLDENEIIRKAINARRCAISNHSKEHMNKVFMDTVLQISNTNS